MIAFLLASLLGYVLPVFAAIFVAIMMIVHRRGGARVTGILGAFLVILGKFSPMIISIIGIGAAGLSGATLDAGVQPGRVVNIIAAFGPAVLTGVGIFLICVAAVSGARKRATLEGRRIADEESAEVN